MRSKNDLIELPIDDWVTLRDMYLTDWPEHNTRYNALDNAIRLLRKEAEKYRGDFKIRTLNGEWKKDGVFIMIIDKPRCGILFGTLADNNDRLKIAIELLNCTTDWYFYAVTDKLRPVVHHYANFNNFIYKTPHPCVFSYLRKEDAVKLEIP
ncbi:GLYATL3.2 family protein [Megaselia abdita]